jgi:preprotein translocase subunit SecA
VLQANTQYQALYQSLASRQRRTPAATGLDKFAVVAQLRIRQRRITVPWLRHQAELIDRISPELRHHTDAALSQRISDIREVFLRGRQDDDAVRRGFAVTREVARRETGEEPYLVQLMGAMAMYHSCIAEMLTGEGKTLTAATVAPLLAWEHRHLHIFTVNDYLAKRDAEGRTPIFARLGLRCGAIQQELQPAERAAVYALPIVYGTPKQIVADYLRDQIKLGNMTSAWTGMRELGNGSMASPAGAPPPGPLVPGLTAAMVDEADGVLIDEAVVPLIIAQSRKSDEMSDIYRTASELASQLTIREHYTADLLRRKVELTRQGKARCAELFASCPAPIWRATRRAEELIRQSLVARHCYNAGRQYAVIDGRVQIIDEFTGRIMPDRSWEHGLHQAVEAKESVEVTADRETIARMSFQRFFRMYPLMCGMTGTAADATGELQRVFQRRVIVIPTNRPVARNEMPTRIFRTAAARWDAVTAAIVQVHATGRPILVGTRSVEASEIVSRALTDQNIDHRVLNAVQDKEEATLVAKAGQLHAVTVATNMAGRGTDIKIMPEAKKKGGLHVILTEMHAARRIDRQFIGRAGRQGDPGSAQSFLSLQDELITLYTKRLGTALANLTSGASGDELSSRSLVWAKRLFKLAQARAQHRDRNMRSEVLRQDDWVEKHLPGM